MSTKIKHELQRFWELVVIVLVVGLFTNILASNIEVVIDQYLTQSQIIYSIFLVTLLLIVGFYYKFSPIIIKTAYIETPLLWLNEYKNIVHFDESQYRILRIMLNKFEEKYPNKIKELFDFSKGSYIFHNLMQCLLIFEFGTIIQTSKYSIDDLSGFSNTHMIKEILNMDFIKWGDEQIPKKFKENIFLKSLDDYSIEVEIPKSLKIIFKDDPFKIIIENEYIILNLEYSYSMWRQGYTPKIATSLPESFKINYSKNLKNLPESDAFLINTYLIMKIVPKKWWWALPIFHSRGMRYWEWMQKSMQNFKGFYSSQKPSIEF